MLAVLNRHPRYVYLLVGILVCTAFLLTTGRPEPPRLAWGGDRALKRALREEDLRYDQNLRARQDLVRKWGPTDDRVAAFPEPSTGYFYTLWDFFLPAYRCPHNVERVGTMGDGGKWVCGMERVARQRRPCAIYSFGVNGESSFEAELLERLPQCEVWGYDFSVNSFGPEVASVPALKARSHFFPYALGKEDKPYGNPPTYTLQTLMQKNGHDFIDILKIDIEGAEFESLDAFLDVFEAQHGAFSSDAHPHGPPHEPALPIGQMQIEIHAWGAWGAESFSRFRQWWERLERAGLRPFFTEPNLVYVNLVRGSRPTLSEYAFMNIRGHHALVSDGY